MSIAQIQFLYTNIGRGHPFYLDGIRYELKRRGIVDDCHDVFSISNGISRQAWRVVYALYRHGSSPGLTSRLYRHLRRDTDYHQAGFALHLLGRSVRSTLAGSGLPLVVAHPSLVAILRGRRGVYYQHGELVTPRESVVHGAEAIFVPTQAAATPFIDAGYDTDTVIVTGMCIEPGIVDQAESAFGARMSRIVQNGPLTGGFFSSGAEPRAHIQHLIDGVHSVLQADGQAIVVARNQGRLHRALMESVGAQRVSMATLDTSSVLDPGDNHRLLLGLHTSRAEEEKMSVQVLPRLDFLAAPPHERTNWSMGLGLPMFVIGPDVGPFAPLNRSLLLRSGVAFSVQSGLEARSLGTRLQELRRSGKLAEMARCGWGHHALNGFEKIGALLAARIAGNASH